MTADRTRALLGQGSEIAIRVTGQKVSVGAELFTNSLGVERLVALKLAQVSGSYSVVLVKPFVVRVFFDRALPSAQGTEGGASATPLDQPLLPLH